MVHLVIQDAYRMSYSRLYNAAGVIACKPVLLHPILMSIIFENYKQLKKLESAIVNNEKQNRELI
jgi:hypothetical protein